MNTRRIVFCDFDGTITCRETFVEMCKYIDIKLFNKLSLQMKQSKMTVKQGVRTFLESTLSERYQDIIKFIKAEKIRDGFDEFLLVLEENNVRFVIISGGLKGVIKAKLVNINKIHAIHAADVNTENKYLKVTTDYEDEEELVAKVQVMNEYIFKESVVIGDGKTDFNIAMNSKIVFARKNLARYLDIKKIPYHQFKDFHDIRKILEKIWGSTY